ncbi:HAMP domain-containing sensor histidine kinase [Paraburkholderia sp. IMGN_8]|uniref:sensor histidine kinase n=1 Tax=Paraburkholderia sp. IMGN_8 TaxID=3136564 RepID=UPI003100F046
MDEMIERPFRQTAVAFLNGYPSIDDPVDAPQLKDQILAVVAHELRGPLSPLRLASQLIRRVSADRPEVVRSIDVIDRQICQIARLADDLMDATRAGHGALRVHRTCVDLIDVLADPFEAAALAAAKRGQILTLQVPDRALRVEGDPVRLAQAIHNLLHNAVKYTPADGRITVTARAEGKDLVVSVKDNGLGISGALLPHVFDLFAQASRTLAASAGGLGVGLAVVKAIAEAHGGTVTATSAGPGTGSEFTLRLPIVTNSSQNVCLPGPDTR